jgi:hypothetical protein
MKGGDGPLTREKQAIEGVVFERELSRLKITYNRKGVQ